MNLWPAFNHPINTETAESYIYRRLSMAPQSAQASILISPPSNLFIGIWRFLRTTDFFAFNVAFVTLLAKFTPILLSNVPFRNTVTWKIHETCTWTAVAVLSYMVLVLITSLVIQVFAKKWGQRQRLRHMPAKLDTIVGCMYYLVESSMLKEFEGLERMGRKERDRLVCNMGRLYYLFGEGGGTNDLGMVGEGVRVCDRVDYFVLNTSEGREKLHNRRSTQARGEHTQG